MTGFGEGAAQSARLRVEVRLRSLNHRFLDLALRLPDELRGLERLLEERLRDRLHRGRVEVRVDLEPLGEREVSVRLRPEVAREILAAQERLQAEGVEGGLTVYELLRLPGVLEVDLAPPGDEEVGELVGRATGAAVEALLASREAEGGRLAGLLQSIASELGSVAGKLDDARDRSLEAIGEALRSRLAELVAEPGLPEERLAQEVAILVDRSDVREELDRLRAHLAHFRDVLGESGAVGKRLDFLAQEMLRELNTLGAKCRDADMTRQVVEGKHLCEQLREQIQNVE